MTTERDEGTQALVAAVLRGDPGEEGNTATRRSGGGHETGTEKWLVSHPITFAQEEFPMSVYHNDRCDRCDEVRETLIGFGPGSAEAWGYDVITVCLGCLGAASAEEYYCSRPAVNEDDPYEELL
jgi:hypothetical protein